MDDTGSGKTKQLIDLANAAVQTEHGNVVCIEPKKELTYDIDYNIRLIASNEYTLPTYEVFQGFLSGIYAGNYDITHIFIDNLTKIYSCCLTKRNRWSDSWTGWRISARKTGSSSPSPCPPRLSWPQTASRNIPERPKNAQPLQRLSGAAFLQCREEPWEKNHPVRRKSLDKGGKRR